MGLAVPGEKARNFKERGDLARPGRNRKALAAAACGGQGGACVAEPHPTAVVLLAAGLPPEA